MKLEFTRYDFIAVGPHAALNSKWTPEQAAKIANARLAEMLKDATVVYGNIGTVYSVWSTNKPGTFIQENLTHKALLIQIEKIKKECKHEPFGLDIYASNCKHCGVELISEWREK